MRRRPPAPCSTASASRSTPTASPRASRSPTSRSSRSRRPSRSTPRSSSWTNRPPHSPASRSTASSQVARALRDAGAGIMFISHRFDEVFALCDRITVMRDGRYIATHVTSESPVDAIVRADGRPRHRRPLPQAGRGDRRRGPHRRRAVARRRLLRHLVHGARGRDRRPRRDSSAPDAPRSPAPSSASTPTTPGASRSTASRVEGRRPAGRDRRRHRLRPRGPPQAGSRDGPVGRPQRDAHPPPPARAVRPHLAAAANARRPRSGRPASR